MKFLESAGHQTEIVENGALALEAVKKNFYDVSSYPHSSRVESSLTYSFADRTYGSEHAVHGRCVHASTLIFE